VLCSRFDDIEHLRRLIASDITSPIEVSISSSTTCAIFSAPSLSLASITGYKPVDGEPSEVRVPEAGEVRRRDTGTAVGGPDGEPLPSLLAPI
jgi:hypothetical protein